MRAWTYTIRGVPAKPFTLQTLSEPLPSHLSPHDVLIKVACCTASTCYHTILKLPHLTSNPWIPELGFSGTVKATGSDVTRVSVGDEVFGGQDLATHLKRGGTAAEMIVVPEGLVARLPRGVEMNEAAGLGVLGCTAVQLLAVGGVRRGGRLLVTAAGSLVGSTVVRLARDLVEQEGMVVGTCGHGSERFVKGLGVDETIDHTSSTPLHEYLVAHHARQPFDSIIDISGSDPFLYDKSPSCLSSNGTFVFAGNIAASHNPNGGIFSMFPWMLRVRSRTMWPVLFGGTPRKAIVHSAVVTTDSLDRVAGLVAAGNFTVDVYNVYAMEDLSEASDSHSCRTACSLLDQEMFVLTDLIVFQAYEDTARGVKGLTIIRVG